MYVIFCQLVNSFISIMALGICSKSLCKVTTDFLSLCRKGWTNSFGSVNYCLANGVFLLEIKVLFRLQMILLENLTCKYL